MSRDLLLQDWADFYQQRARKQRQSRFYMHARDVQSAMRQLAGAVQSQSSPNWALSFQAGASLVAPFSIFSEVHVVIAGPVWERSVKLLANHLKLEPAREEANVILVEPYYRESWRYGIRWIQELPVVSDLQLYLDLQLHPMRGKEQASRILPRLVGKEPSVSQ